MEECFVRARGHLCSIRQAARALLDQKNSLQQSEHEAMSRAETATKELNICRMRISQVHVCACITSLDFGLL